MLYLDATELIENPGKSLRRVVSFDKSFLWLNYFFFAKISSLIKHGFHDKIPYLLHRK